MSGGGAEWAPSALGSSAHTLGPGTLHGGGKVLLGGVGAGAPFWALPLSGTDTPPTHLLPHPHTNQL